MGVHKTSSTLSRSKRGLTRRRADDMNEAEIAAGLARTPSYRYAQLVRNQLFIAGQVPRNSAGELVAPDDAQGQAKQCLDNLELLLSVHQFSRTDVRQLVIYVVGDQRRMQDAWSAVTAWFTGEVPPATLLGVSRLGYEGQLVEVDATVIKAEPT